MKGCYGVFGGVFNRETPDASRDMQNEFRVTKSEFRISRPKTSLQAQVLSFETRYSQLASSGYTGRPIRLASSLRRNSSIT